MAAVVDKKRLLRAQFKQRRMAVTEEEYKASSVKACQYAVHYCSQLRNTLQRPLRIFAYLPFGKELDITPLLMKCRRIGDEVYLPRTVFMNRTMTLHLWNEQTRFSVGCFGLREPNVNTKPLSPEKWRMLDMVIIPGIAFDCYGGRLGLGAGYYDWFWYTYVRSIELENTPVQPIRIDAESALGDTEHKPHLARISCLYSWQMIDEVPMELHDIVVERLFTEQGVIICKYRENAF